MAIAIPCFGWTQGQREFGTVEMRALLHRQPMTITTNWVRHLNRAQADAGFKTVRHVIRRGSHFGTTWYSSLAPLAYLRLVDTTPGELDRGCAYKFFATRQSSPRR